jgi:hypothetical protein
MSKEDFIAIFFLLLNTPFVCTTFCNLKELYFANIAYSFVSYGYQNIIPLNIDSRLLFEMATKCAVFKADFEVSVVKRVR